MFLIHNRKILSEKNYKDALNLLLNHPKLDVGKIRNNIFYNELNTPCIAIDYALKNPDLYTIKLLLNFEGTKIYLKQLKINKIIAYFLPSLNTQNKELIKLLLDYYYYTIGITSLTIEITHHDIIFDNFIEHPIIDFNRSNSSKWDSIFLEIMERYNISPIIDKRAYYLRLIKIILEKDGFDINNIQCNEQIYDELMKDLTLRELVFRYYTYSTSLEFHCCCFRYKITYHRKD